MPKKLPLIVRGIINNPPEPINFAYQKNISYSQMSIFRSCAYRWKLKYKDKIMNKAICEFICKVTYGKLCLGWCDEKCCK